MRLYVSESSHWEWTRVAGAVALATTNEPGRYLYVVDLNVCLMVEEGEEGERGGCVCV